MSALLQSHKPATSTSTSSGGSGSSTSDTSVAEDLAPESNSEAATELTVAAPASGEGEHAALTAGADNSKYLAMAENTRGGFAARAIKEMGSTAAVADILTAGNLDKPITRAAAAAVAAKVGGLGSALEGQPAVFTDVPLSHWAATYIYRCRETGIMNGVGNNAFGPNDTLESAGATLVLSRISDPEWRSPFDREDALALAAKTRDMPESGGLDVGSDKDVKRSTTDDIYDKHAKMLADTKLKLEDSGLKAGVSAFKKIFEANRSRYEAVAAQTGIPAELIAALHFRESSGNFNTYLHQGDPLGKPPVHWPTNIPTFTKWEDAAVHALKMKGSVKKDLGMTEKTTDLASMATFAEYYNGLGYHNRDRVSPYVYSGTDEYSKGKYVADGKFDPNYVDKQVGVVALVKSVSGEAQKSTLLEGQVIQGGKAASGAEVTVTDAKGKQWKATTTAGGFYTLEGTVASGRAVVRSGGSATAVTVTDGKPSWAALNLDVKSEVKDTPVETKTDTKPKTEDKSTSGGAAALSLNGEVLKRGSKGGLVKQMQTLLIQHGAKITADGDFGPATEAAVKAFQASHGLTADGVVGPKTAAALSATSSKGDTKTDTRSDTKSDSGSNDAGSSSWLGGKVLRQGDKGDTVKALQRLLNAKGASLSVDGDFGPGTAAAVKAFQSANGLSSDGVVGPMTGAKLTSSGAKNIGSAPKDTGSSSGGDTGATRPKDDGKYDSVAEERGAAAAKSARITYTEGKKDHGSGTWETQGSNKGPWVNKFKEANKAGASQDLAWCGMFVGYNYAKAGVRPEIIRNLAFWSGYRLHLFLTQGKYLNGQAGSWWTKHDTKSLAGLTGTSRKKALDSYGPQPGDIVLFRSDYSHVAMVDYYDEATGTLYILEGNRSNKVQATTYGSGSDDITFIGRLNNSDYGSDSEIDPTLAKANDPLVKHNDGDFGSTR